ncbi:MAG: hypothetical protein VB074_02800 [Proteiniphilum sp.]|jgi:hypothetical protein|uniref:hypothetical protein n=1 Tax=Proteiniphilum sp. TaxID=1926877 RepID=UPI000926407C|nr:hypothetical protein [Proteiniphilum sp.]MEA5127089.1 hypothetical protein [Proteiniphilum sp.]OJV75581.1 MAG: hypothetical protein BGO34_01145 [Bacteroidia bacterium 44-10]
MKTVLPFMFILIVLLQFSCSKENDEIDSKSLKGVWVHTDTKTDTIDFSTRMFVSGKTFELKRGKEIRNGYELPKTGSGFYTYEIKGDSIYLRDVISSSGGSLPFYFKIDPDKKSFEIESFAPFTGGLMVNRFRKIK